VFEQNPRRYAPQNLGCDPVLLLSDQRAISGRIQYGAFFDGNLYLFRSEDNRALFRKNPLRYTRIRHAVRVEEIEGRRVL
jgi:YHS domain-containing protein